MQTLTLRPLRVEAELGQFFAALGNEAAPLPDLTKKYQSFLNKIETRSIEIPELFRARVQENAKLLGELISIRNELEEHSKKTVTQQDDESLKISKKRVSKILKIFYPRVAALSRVKVRCRFHEIFNSLRTPSSLTIMAMNKQEELVDTGPLTRETKFTQVEDLEGFSFIEQAEILMVSLEEVSPQTKEFQQVITLIYNLIQSDLEDEVATYFRDRGITIEETYDKHGIVTIGGTSYLIDGPIHSNLQPLQLYDTLAKEQPPRSQIDGPYKPTFMKALSETFKLLKEIETPTENGAHYFIKLAFTRLNIDKVETKEGAFIIFEGNWYPVNANI